MKLLATDYDGTLRYAKHVMQEDLDAIKKWKEAGNLFVISTGRSYASIKKQLEEHNIECDYIISNNGGWVFDKEGKVLISSKMDYLTGLDVIYIAKTIDGVCSYAVNDGINRHRIVVNPNLVEHRYPNLEPDISEEEVMDRGEFAQIVISMTEQSLARNVSLELMTHFGGEIEAYANNFVVDVVPKNVSKVSGLSFVAAYEDIDDADIYTIGDSYNDIPLMEYGMNGAAMSTSYEDIKEHAKYIYDSVGEMIEKILEQ
ncbi:MAG: HAD-IIB family hydrolase [Bacillota bacterium]|nr:HAD-IIB family hydrolase [Bacillota bacterium]